MGRSVLGFGMVGAAVLGALAIGGAARADTRDFAAAGTALLVEDPCAKHVSVVVDPSLAGRIAVEAAATHPEEIAQLAVAPEGGEDGERARVGLARDRRECWRLDPHGPFEPTLMLTVRIPQRFPVGVSEGGEGDYAIGAVGPLDLRMAGEATVAVDAVDGDVRIELSGEGKVSVGRLDAEQLRVELSGAGSVRVRDGRIGAVRVSESGEGAVRIDPAVRDARLSVSGMGTIALGGVSGTLTRAVSGMATITVAGRRVGGGGGDEGD